MKGFIKTVIVDRGFGFVTGEDGRDLFFHVNDLDHELDFCEQLRERRVAFEVISNERGSRAVNVRAV